MDYRSYAVSFSHSSKRKGDPTKVDKERSEVLPILHSCLIQNETSTNKSRIATYSKNSSHELNAFETLKDCSRIAFNKKAIQNDQANPTTFNLKNFKSFRTAFWKEQKQ